MALGGQERNQEIPGSVLRSERFVVSVEWQDQRRKVFQFQFAKRDGTIFVSFPYFRHTSGIVSLVSWPAGQSSAVVSLEPGGRVASHLVKYSHHPNGRAHFSQDRKVKTVIKKDAVPLSDLDGHLFTLLVHGLDAFEPLNEGERNTPPSPKRTGVRFTLEGEAPQAIKFVGRLHRDTSLERRAVDGKVHPIMKLMTPDETERLGFVCSTTLGLPGQERCLLTTCEPLPRMDGVRESSLLFIAGFDPAASMNDVGQPVTFLALAYPAENVEDLRRRLGSIDFNEAV